MRQRYRVAPEPPPQLSLREEIAIYKAKLREIKAARIAATPTAVNNVIKPKKRSTKHHGRRTQCFESIGNHFKAIYNTVFSDFKRKCYTCMGFFCCMSSEIRVFVDEEFPKAQVPVV